MADLTYKGVTLVEQERSGNVRAHSYWVGLDGSVELSVGLNEDSGVYTAHARVIRPNPRGAGNLRLPAGVADGLDFEVALDTACAAFVARADKPEGQKKPRELDIRPADRAAMRTVIDRARGVRVR